VRETRFGAVENLCHADKRFFKVSFVDRDVDGSGRVVAVPRGDRGHAQYQRSAISWKGLMFTISTWLGFAAGHFARLAKPLKAMQHSSFCIFLIKTG